MYITPKKQSKFRSGLEELENKYKDMIGFSQEQLRAAKNDSDEAYWTAKVQAYRDVVEDIKKMLE